MIKYNYCGKELILAKQNYTDGHLCITIEDTEGNYVDRLSTNFPKETCKRHLGNDLKDNEILICMTPSMEHPLIRGLAIDMEENGLLMCWFDCVRTYNEYYRYKLTVEAMKMLESECIVEFIPEEYNNELSEEDFEDV